MIRKFAAWFTLARRQAIQLFAAGLAPLAIMFGLGTEGGWEQSLILVGLGTQFVSNLLNLLSLKEGEWGKGWAIVRGAIYSLGLGAAPALVALGIWTDEVSTQFALGLGLALAAVGNAVALVTGQRQETEQAVARASEPGSDLR